MELPKITGILFYLFTIINILFIYLRAFPIHDG